MGDVAPTPSQAQGRSLIECPRGKGPACVVPMVVSPVLHRFRPFALRHGVRKRHLTEPTHVSGSVELGTRIGHAQVEATPNWAAMTPADFEKWTQATYRARRCISTAPWTDVASEARAGVGICQ